MKRFSLILFLSLGITTVHAQLFYPLGVGIGLTGQMGVNAGDIPQGEKTELAIAPLPNFFASAWYIVSQEEDFGFALDVGYTTNTFIMKPYQNVTNQNRFQYMLSYLSVHPYIRFKMFNLGVGLGFPLSGKRENVAGTISQELSDLATAIELRFKLSVPVYRDATGKVSFWITGAYQLNGIYASDIPNNPKVASAGIGFSYHFHFRLWEY